MIRRYPVVYTYIAVTLLIVGVGEVLAAKLGILSPDYLLLFAWFLLVHAAVGISVLLQIYLLRRKPSLADAHLLVFLALMLTRPFFWTESIWLSYRLLTGAQMLQTYLGMSAFARLFYGGRILPGWNLPMVVVAITFSSIFRSLIIAEYLFGVHALSHASSSLGMELTTIGSWVIFVFGLWHCSPPRPFNMASRRKDIKARIWANIKILRGVR